MKVVLVTINGVPVSIGVGKYCFPIEGGKVGQSESQRIGAEVSMRMKVYLAAYELAMFAWEAQEFDGVEKH